MLHVLNNVPRVVYGVGSISKTGDEAVKMGCKRAFVVTDEVLSSLGLLKPLEEALKASGIEYSIFDKTQNEPSATSIQACSDAAKAFKADCMIGVGGGSVLDSTKAAIVLLTNQGKIEDYFGMQMVKNPVLPMILVPTSAGTGSEVTSISVLTNPATGAKMGVVSDYLYARLVILDPNLTTAMPPHVTAMTGVDAFVHAMESFVGVAATPFTDALNLQAMRLVADNLRKAYANGQNIEARTGMLYGATLAGMGFSQTQNGIIHAVGTNLPSTCKLPHGLLMAALAPMGMSFNCIATPEKYAVVAEILGVEHSGNDLETARAGIEAMYELLADVGIKTGLKAHGVPEDALEGTAERAAGAKRLMDNNPRKANAKQILALLKEHY